MNEEMLSANEELQSTNEELSSTMSHQLTYLLFSIVWRMSLISLRRTVFRYGCGFFIALTHYFDSYFVRMII